MKHKELFKLLDDIKEEDNVSLPKRHDRVLLIDGLNLFFRNFAMLNMVNPDLESYEYEDVYQEDEFPMIEMDTYLYDDLLSLFNEKIIQTIPTQLSDAVLHNRIKDSPHHKVYEIKGLRGFSDFGGYSC